MVPALGLDPVAQGQLTELPYHFQTLLFGTKDRAARSGLSGELVLQGPRVRLEAAPSVGLGLVSTGLCWRGRWGGMDAS